MEYEVLYLNDNGTAKVRMTIDDHILEQDFAVGESQDEFQSNITQGMAIFQSEITANVPAAAPFDINSIMGQPQTVDSLPEIPDPAEQ